MAGGLTQYDIITDNFETSKANGTGLSHLPCGQH